MQMITITIFSRFQIRLATVVCIAFGFEFDSQGQNSNSPPQYSAVTQSLKSILSERNDLIRNGTLYEFIKTINPASYGALWESYSKTRDRVNVSDKSNPGPVILQLMAMEEPEIAVKLALEENFPAARHRYLEAVAVGWAENDLDSAISWISQNLDLQTKERIMGGFTVALAKKDPLKAIQFLEENMQSKTAERFMGDIFQEWGRINPKAAAKYLNRSQKLMGDSRAHRALASEWAIQDYDSAKKWVLSIQAPKIKQEALRMISRVETAVRGNQKFQPFDHLPFNRNRHILVRGIAQLRAHNELNRAIEWMHSLSDHRDKSSAYSGLAEIWMKIDVDSMLQHLDLHPEGREKDSLISQAAGILAAQDLNKAKEWLNSLPVGSGRTDAFMSVASSLTKINPEAAISWLKNIPNEQDFLRASTQTVQVLSRTQPDRVIEFVNSLPQGELRNRILRYALVGLQSNQPAKAIELLVGQPITEKIKSNLHQVTLYWAQSSFDEAMSYASNMGNSEYKNAVYSGLISRWFGKDPESARSFAMSVSDTAERGVMLRCMLASIGGTDLEKEIIWLESLPQPQLPMMVIPSLFSRLANHVPPKAAVLVEKIQTEEIRNECSHIVVNAWSRFEPENAIQWIRKNKNKQLRMDLYESVIMHWLDENAALLDTILQNQEEDEEKETLIELYVKHALHFEPESAVSWANRLKDPKSRIQNLFETLKVWHRKDPKKAKAWLKASDLPDEIKKMLIEPSEKKPDSSDEIA